ncbi:MAG: multidrug effflux MFS transporter [Pseudohongiellaceae bacterium]
MTATYHSPRALPRGTILLLAITSALGPVAMQILLPAIPQLGDSFAIDAATAQLTLSLSMVSIAVATLFYGPLSDRYGRKPVILGGIVLTFIGSVLCSLAPTIETLIAGRIVQAAGGAVGLVVARAVVRDAYPADQAASMISTLVMFMVVMPMLSPAVGGELLVRFDWHSVFWLVGGLSLVLLVLLLFRLPETLREPVPFTGLGSMFRGFAMLLRSRVFRGYAFSLAFISVMFFSFIAAVPEIMIRVMNRPPNEYGYYFIMVPASFILGNNLSRMISRRKGPQWMTELGSTLAITGIVLALALHLYGLLHPLALFMPIAVTTFGNGLSMPSAQAAAINEFPDRAGAASGLTGFLQMGFAAIAAQLVALIFNGTAYPLLILMLGAALLSHLCFRSSRA